MSEEQFEDWKQLQKDFSYKHKKRNSSDERSISKQKVNVPSITSSPIRHCLRAVQDEKALYGDRSVPTLKNQKKAGLILDRTEKEEEEKKYEIHNANGKFSCECGVCRL